MTEVAVNPVHKPCPACGATLHGPSFRFDGPPATPLQLELGLIPLLMTVEHTAQRCASLRDLRKAS